MYSSAPLVSVVTPVYNAGKYLVPTIKALLDQSVQDLELIVIDDGSTDDSADILASFGDSRIRFIRNESNIGVVRTRNKGIDLCRGKYIAFNDADDIPLRDKLKKQVLFLDANPDVGVCGTFYQLIDPNGVLGDKVDLPSSREDVAFMSKFVNPFCNSATVTRAELIKKLKFEQAYEYAEDFRLWNSLLSETAGYNIPEYELLYRVHGNNISIVNRETMRKRARKLQEDGLHSLGIDAAEQELELHSSFLYCMSHKFSEPAQVAQLEQWLIRLYNTARKRQPDLDRLSLRKLIFDHWIAIVFQLKNYRKLLIPELARIGISDYYRTLARKTLHKMK